MVYGSSYILFESDDPDQLAAWLFVRWLLSPENQADWVNSAGLFPLQASTMGLLTDYAAGHPQWAEAVNLLPQGSITDRAEMRGSSPKQDVASIAAEAIGTAAESATLMAPRCQFLTTANIR